jgi:hypothetical protein
MHDASTSSTRTRRCEATWIALMGVGCALVIGACGGSPKIDVSGTATNATGNQSPIAMSLCMRAHGLSNFPMRQHGVPNFADPTFPAHGGVELHLGSGVDPRSPAFQAAAKACGSAIGRFPG